MQIPNILMPVSRDKYILCYSICSLSFQKYFSIPRAEGSSANIVNNKCFHLNNSLVERKCLEFFAIKLDFHNRMETKKQIREIYYQTGVVCRQNHK